MVFDYSVYSCEVDGFTYTLAFFNGQHEVRRWTSENRFEVVFSGHFEKCLDWLDQLGH